MALALMLTAALGLAGPAAAETDEAPRPGAGLPLGEEVGEAAGDVYVAGEFDDWTKVCERTPDGSDPCLLTQLIVDPEGNPAAEINIYRLPPGGEAVAAANIVLPLGTILSQQISLRVDGGTERRYPFFVCDAGGCYAQIGLTAPVVESFRRGNTATMTVYFVFAPDRPAVLPISLRGFTAGFSALPPVPRG
jgi:invasion protein IalB